MELAEEPDCISRGETHPWHLEDPTAAYSVSGDCLQEVHLEAAANENEPAAQTVHLVAASFAEI